MKRRQKGSSCRCVQKRKRKRQRERERRTGSLVVPQSVTTAQTTVRGEEYLSVAVALLRLPLWLCWCICVRSQKNRPPCETFQRSFSRAKRALQRQAKLKRCTATVERRDNHEIDIWRYKSFGTTLYVVKAIPARETTLCSLNEYNRIGSSGCRRFSKPTEEIVSQHKEFVAKIDSRKFFIADLCETMRH